MAKPVQVQQTIVQFFKDRKYNYDIEQKEAWVLFSTFKGVQDNDSIGIVFVVHNNDINVTATFLQPVHKDSYSSIAEILLKINNYLKRGHFFLDYSIGAVNFKIWNSAKGRFTGKDVDELLLMSIGSVETVMKVIRRFTQKEITVDQAVSAYIKQEDIR